MNAIKNNLYTLLRKSESFFKTDMIYLVKGGSWLGLSQIITIAAGFGLSLAFTNLLSPDTYGIYKYILSVVSLLLITTLHGVDSAVMQSVARGFDGTFVEGIKTKITWGLWGSLGSLILGIYYYTHGNIFLGVGFFISAIFIPFIESFDLYNSVLNGKKLFRQFSQWNMVKKILPTLILIGTLSVTENIFIIILAYFLPLLALNFFFFIKTKNEIISNTEIDGTAMKFGKHLSGLSILSTLASELDKILVFQFLGATELAIYTMAVAPTDQIKGILKNINTLAFPKFAERTRSEVQKTVISKALLLGVVTSCVILGYILLAPLFYTTFFPKYVASIAYSQVLSISLVAGVIISFFYTALESQKAKEELYTYNIYENIFSLLILVPFVYYFGIWGAVTSRFISRAFSMGLGIFLIRRMN